MRRRIRGWKRMRRHLCLQGADPHGARIARGAIPSLSPDRLVTKKVPARGLRRYGAAVRFAAMENQHGGGRRQNASPGSADIGEAAVNYITELPAPNDANRCVFD